MKRYFYLFILLLLFSECGDKSSKSGSWTLILEQPGKDVISVVKLPSNLTVPFKFHKIVDEISIDFLLEPKINYCVFKATATPINKEKKCYFTLKYNYTHGTPFNFHGEVVSDEIFRQSPHNQNAWSFPDMATQPYPMIAIKDTTGLFSIAVNSPPAFYENYTTQQFYPSKNEIELSSGDNGKTPGMVPSKEPNRKLANNQLFDVPVITEYFHNVTKEKPHVFDGIMLTSSAKNLNELRRDIALIVSDHWANGKYKDYFGSLVFTSVFMNVRLNETGRSRYWVVPSVEYSNTQYCRDAFWISSMLPDSLAEECLLNELNSNGHFSEYPLYIPVWAYRIKRNGGNVDLEKVQKYIDIIEAHIRDGYYYTFDPNDKRKDYQYWQDQIAFDPSDPITFNQGLMAVSMLAAKELGLKTRTSFETAVKSYNSMFNRKLGFFPMSRQKDSILTPDPFTGDLLSQILFGKKLLDPELVKLHYEKVVNNAKTPYGFKINCMPDGAYVPSRLYTVPGFTADINTPGNSDGQYLRGGSWTLYDLMFLIDSYLYNIPGSYDELLWRSAIDFRIGSTVYECINTLTGKAQKPNMGWDAAAYYFWKQLIDAGKADDKLFTNIDNIVYNR